MCFLCKAKAKAKAEASEMHIGDGYVHCSVQRYKDKARF
jgi:hypothetical protein